MLGSIEDLDQNGHSLHRGNENFNDKRQLFNTTLMVKLMFVVLENPMEDDD